MNAIYFLAGVLSTLAGLLLWPSRREKPASPRPWFALERLTWKWRFDYTLPRVMTGNEVALVVAELIRQQVERKPLSDFEVEPASYSILLAVDASFIRRED